MEKTIKIKANNRYSTANRQTLEKVNEIKN